MDGEKVFFTRIKKRLYYTRTNTGHRLMLQIKKETNCGKEI